MRKYFFIIFVLIPFFGIAKSISDRDTIPPDTVRTKTLTNYIIRSDTLKTDTVITYYIYEDTTITDTSVSVINFLGSRSKDTTVIVTKITKPSPWKIGGNGSFQFSQGYLNPFWVKGGESSISTIMGLNLFANYKKKKVSWDNFMLINYGQLKSGETGFRKNEDKFEINTKFGHKAFKNFFYSFMAEFKSQLFKGYEYIPNDSVEGGFDRNVLSKLMAPGNLIIAVGLDFKPEDNLSVLVSPLTGKFTFVLDTNGVQDYTTFGLEQGERVKKELGSYVKVQYKWDITKNIQLESKLDLFSNYIENPQNIDINWENFLVMKINKYISANIATHLIYDHDVLIPVFDGEEPKINEYGEQATTRNVQFKEMLSVGFSYKF